MTTVEGKTRRQALTEFREAEILHAARKVFGEHGFANASVDMVAAEAGIAKGTLYLYFDSKEAMFWEAIRARFQEMLDQTKREIEQESGTEAKLRALARVRFGFLKSDEQFLRMYYTEFGSLCRREGPHYPSFRQIYMDGARYIAGVLEQGMAAGELRTLPPLETAMALIDMIKGVFAMRFMGEHQNPEFDGERFVFDLFWNGISSGAKS